MRTGAASSPWPPRTGSARSLMRMPGSGASGPCGRTPRRSMAIETGVIEGLYDPSHGVTQALIQEGFRVEHVCRQGVDVEPEHLVAVLQDHMAAADMVYGYIREDRPITKHVLRELHARITAHQETHTAIDMLGRRVQCSLRRGVWKDFPNNPTRPDGTVHLYAPPEQVDSQLDLLLEQYGTYEPVQHPLLTGAGCTIALSKSIPSRMATGARDACF